MSRLFYRNPADWDWEKALPIGNGKLGAMIFGEKTMEHYQLNEDSLWHGGPMNRVNPDAKGNLSNVRELIFAGKIPEAERLLKFAFTGTPQGERPYQTLGDLYIDLMDTVKNPVDYERELDLEKAVHKVVVKDKESGIRYVREAFASYQKNVIVTRITSDKKESVSAATMISRMNHYDTSWHGNDTVFFSGKMGDDGVSYCAGIKVVAEGAQATVKVIGEHVIAENADAVTIFMTAATTYRCENPTEEVERVLEEAGKCAYEMLLSEHIAEYKAYFDTCRLELSYDRENDNLPTDERLLQEEIDNALLTTYFDYGRYLLIASSRPGSLPANLQGIWNKELAPPWGSKYTININTEMNYWHAEMLGLSDCHLPLFELLEKVCTNGEKTAKEMYGCRGFVAHHNTDLWGDSAPQDMYNPATYWVMGGAWLCTHIWEHYLFTKQCDFLTERYPIMKKAALFFVDFLVEQDGYYVTCPSVSPENTYILPDGTRGCNGYGCTMDNEILRDLFEQCLAASEIVGEEDEEFIDSVKKCLSKLPPIRVGTKGQILEWIKEYEEAEPGHRHISHLYALHPSSQIMVDETPELAEAAKITLQRRLANGGGHTGWSRAWIINMYARLWDGEKAYDNLIALLKKSTLSNLFDYHPPFQIDGNFGAVAGIGEMLLQSNGGRTVVLPALPEKWRSGSVQGIRGRGGLSYDIAWENSALKCLRVTGLVDNASTRLIVNGVEKVLCLAKGQVYEWEA